MTPQELLADAIFDNRLVILTGAGLSLGLPNANGEPLPNWADALRELAVQVRAGADLQKHIETLTSDGAGGADYSVAASLIRRVAPNDFDALLKAKFTLRKADPIRGRQDDYDAVHELLPRGIITFNVDGGHREWISQHNDLKNWMLLDPTKDNDEGRFGEALRSGSARPFLLEAHGSVETSPVFTAEQYRGLFSSSPAYRAFLEHILSSSRLLMVGFSVDDHDFIRVLDDMSHAYGMPVERHILIEKLRVDRDHERQSITLKELYGVERYEIPDWTDLAPTLRLAASTITPRLAEILEQSLSPELAQRRKAHREASDLSLPAKRSLSEAVLSDLESADLSVSNPEALRRRSEELYLLRSLGLRSGTAGELWGDRIIEIMKRTDHAELLAHAALALQQVARRDHLKAMENLLQLLASAPIIEHLGTSGSRDRVLTYLRQTMLEVQALAGETGA